MIRSVSKAHAAEPFVVEHDGTLAVIRDAGDDPAAASHVRDVPLADLALAENAPAVEQSSPAPRHADFEVEVEEPFAPASYDDYYDDSDTAERRYGTFETSILPYEDCCTVFTPRHPRTKPKIEDVMRELGKVDFDALADEAYATMTTEIKVIFPEYR